MTILELIKNAWEDINDDANVYASRHPKRQYGWRPASQPTVWDKWLLIQLVGGAAGCAFARTLGLGRIGCIVFAPIFAVIIGACKSHLSDGIAWKYAIVKNIIIAVVLLAFYGGILILTLLI